MTEVLMRVICSPSPIAVGATLSTALAVLQVVLDLSGVKADPAVADAFKLAAGSTVSLIAARQIAINSRPPGGNGR